jgi:hypothetical protein
MTSSQLVVYLAFAIGCGLGHLAWLQLLAILRRRRCRVPEPLLNGRERLELEQVANEILQQHGAQDPAARAQFLRAYLHSVPRLTDQLSRHLQQRPEIALRMVADSIRHLPDDRLVQLAERLGCLPVLSDLPIQRQRYQRLRPTWSRPQQMAAAIGVTALLLILLVPPWVAERQRQTRILGVSRSMQILERRATGYHWLLAHTIPNRQKTQRATRSLRSLEFDEYGWRIDYPRLCWQLFTLTLVAGLFVWSTRPSDCRGAAPKWSAWLVHDCA